MRSDASPRGRCSAVTEESAPERVAIQLRDSSSSRRERQRLRSLESPSPAPGALAALLQRVSLKSLLHESVAHTLVQCLINHSCKVLMSQRFKCTVSVCTRTRSLPHTPLMHLSIITNKPTCSRRSKDRCEHVNDTRVHPT